MARHLNEIQIPKEFHAIQEALLASEHRELIALGTPSWPPPENGLPTRIVVLHRSYTMLDTETSVVFLLLKIIVCWRMGPLSTRRSLAQYWG